MLFQNDIEPSLVNSILEQERFRQWRQLIMIPSESIGIPQATELLGTEFGNIYSEGYPEPILCHDPRQAAMDDETFAGWQRRFSDRRFYKGCINTNRVELAAMRSIARVFARLKGSPRAEEIFVNVQPLSGAAANQAVYEAFVPHGGTVMGLNLTHGGHLTHGSQYNFSGKTFRIVSYGIDPQTRRLDYDEIRRLALEHKPKMIISGASAYPWDIDWAALRAIADEVGAIVLADISHLAGMIAAGQLNNPLPHAHVVMTTTHKTLLGPRGALILTTNKDHADRINSAIFPGLQGGPHMNTIAGIARLFELIDNNYDEFVAYQKQVIANTAHLAKALTALGFTLEYGGTNTHLLLIDLKKFKNLGRPDVKVDGEMASRLLELAGIVVNKNTLPGDKDAGASSGIRLGMPWLTQRGITPPQIEQLAQIIFNVLSHVHTTRVWVPGQQERCRGRINPAVLRKAKADTLAIVEKLSWPKRPAEASQTVKSAGSVAAFRLRGPKVASALQQLMTCNLVGLPENEIRPGLLLYNDGTILSRAAAIQRSLRYGEQIFDLVVPAESAEEVFDWLVAASDGYLLFDVDDLYAKIDGPMVIDPIDIDNDPALTSAGNTLLSMGRVTSGDAVKLISAEPELFDFTKTYFAGQRALYAKARVAPKKPYERKAEELPLRQTVLNQTHKAAGAKMVPFAGWEMPLHYAPGIFAEHRAVRTAAGVFDVSHMGLLEISGPHAQAFLETVLANCVSRLAIGQAEYNYVLLPNGHAVDDTFLYRLAPHKFILVVNASNAEAVWDWLSAVNTRQVVIDADMPGKQVDGPVTLRNLRDAGPEGLIDLALQGPLAGKLLMELADTGADAEAISRLKMNHFVKVTAGGIPMFVARTGYTGEKVGFEIFVHPGQAVDLWNALLEKGAPWGVVAAGLGARDSLRTEAGFPLFGHELEGVHGISLTEADYGFVVQMHVPFFVGRAPYIARNEVRKRKLMRLKGAGRKTLRGGHIILNESAQAVGTVTSFAYLDEAMNFVVLALVDANFEPPVGSTVRGYRGSEVIPGAEADEKKTVDLTVLARFPEEKEKESWKEAYSK